MEKIEIYVYSFNISTLNFVDKEGAQHTCAQAGSTAFSGLKRYPGSVDNRYLSDEERKAIISPENFCKKKGIEFEVIDLSTKGFFTKMKLRLKELTNLPTIVFQEKVIHGVPTEEALEKLVAT